MIPTKMKSPDMKTAFVAHMGNGADVPQMGKDCGKGCEMMPPSTPPQPAGKGTVKKAGK